MTGSYSCMTLLSTLIFDTASDEDKLAWVKQIAKMGREVVSREDEIASYLAGDFNRVTYLGSGSYVGLAQESQLKILELAHGLVATSWDSSMGYRHGPKSFVDDKTLVFVFVNNDPYTRQYDLDILNEINGDKIAQKTIAIQQDCGPVFEASRSPSRARLRCPRPIWRCPSSWLRRRSRCSTPCVWATRPIPPAPPVP